MKEASWKKIFPDIYDRIRIRHSTENVSEASLIYLACKEKLISSETYLNWAHHYYAIAILEDHFFEERFNRTVFEKYSSFANWSEEFYPALEWDGVLFIACMDPYILNSLKLEIEVRPLLASYENITKGWKIINATDSPKNKKAGAIDETAAVDKAAAVDYDKTEISYFEDPAATIAIANQNHQNTILLENEDGSESIVHVNSPDKKETANKKPVELDDDANAEIVLLSNDANEEILQLSDKVNEDIALLNDDESEVSVHLNTNENEDIVLLSDDEPEAAPLVPEESLILLDDEDQPKNSDLMELEKSLQNNGLADMPDGLELFTTPPPEPPQKKEPVRIPPTLNRVSSPTTPLAKTNPDRVAAPTQSPTPPIQKQPMQRHSVPQPPSTPGYKASPVAPVIQQQTRVSPPLPQTPSAVENKRAPNFPPPPPPPLGGTPNQENSDIVKAGVNSIDRELMETVKENLNRAYKYYNRVMLLIVNSNETVSPIHWDQNFKPKTSTHPISLFQPSPFRIAYKTAKPFHGPVTMNHILELFINEWLNNDPIHILTIVPLIENNTTFALLLGIADHNIDLKESLIHFSRITEDVTKQISISAKAKSA
jgi:hypothetical protein